MVGPFSIDRLPRIIFGPNRIRELPGLIRLFGTQVHFLVGASSFVHSPTWEQLQEELQQEGITFQLTAIPGEPSPSMIDACVQQLRPASPDCVVAIGGGSVLDAGKAVSAMIREDAPLKTYLEGVGHQRPSGVKVPFIAVPTTAGTGSESTKNAVISEVGSQGFKKSLRHDNYVPDIALVDPVLTLSCPTSVTASSGMDAFSQLLESYLSTKASRFTDALAWEGLSCIQQSLVKAIKTGDDLEARSDLAYAALLSGITLAHAGLGTVHGFASSVGARFPIPHGVVCGSLMGPVNRRTLTLLDKTHVAYQKYVRVGKLLCSQPREKPDSFYAEALVALIDRWTEEFQLPRFASFGMKETDIPAIVDSTTNKNNPVELGPQELAETLKERL